MKFPSIESFEESTGPTASRLTATFVSPVITLRSAAVVPPIETSLAPFKTTPLVLIVAADGWPFGPTPMKFPETDTSLALTVMAEPIVNPTRSSPSTLLPAAGVSKIKPLSTVPPPLTMTVRTVLAPIVRGLVLADEPGWV